MMHRSLGNTVLLSANIRSGGTIDHGSHAGLPEVSCRTRTWPRPGSTPAARLRRTSCAALPVPGPSAARPRPTSASCRSAAATARSPDWSLERRARGPVRWTAQPEAAMWTSNSRGTRPSSPCVRRGGDQAGGAGGWCASSAAIAPGRGAAMMTPLSAVHPGVAARQPSRAKPALMPGAVLARNRASSPLQSSSWFTPHPF